MGSPENFPVSVSRQDWSLRRKGPEDEARHNEKVKDAIKDNLPNIISDGSIITADPATKRLVKVPLKSLEIPRIRYGDEKEGIGSGSGEESVGDVIDMQPTGDPGQGAGEAGTEPGVEYYEAEFTIEEIQQMVFDDLGLPNLKQREKQELPSEVVLFDDIRKKRSTNNLDLNRTIYANIQRNAEESGKAEIRDIKPEDFRVKTWNEQLKDDNSAVVLAMADISGSMGDHEKYITRAFCWWTVGFLKQKYPNVDIAFIAHDTEAQEVTEEEFFSRGSGGGTKCSSANELALDMINTRFRPEQYNIYPLHFSDGDNYSTDDQLCVSLVKNMLEMDVNQYAYVQIGSKQSSLRNAYENNVHDERFKTIVINDKSDVLPSLKKIFPPDNEN